MSLRSMSRSLKLRPRPARPATRCEPLGGRGPCRSVEPLESRLLMSAYVQTNLAADEPGTSLVHDPELIDAQGIAINPGGTFWVSARATGVSTVYSGDVTRPDGTRVPFVKSTLTVTIPGGSPTGQVFSGSNDFVVSSGAASAPARFIFASETGHITGWSAVVPAPPPPPPSRIAQLKASTPGAVYTGLAIANNGAANFLYAADFQNGKIDVFDKTYTPTTPAGSFDDPTIPNAYSPINIQNLGGKLYVAYARQDGDGDGLPGKGAGFVSIFDTDGHFLNRVVSGNHLNAPWGMALAPANFGEFSNALLVASTAKGRINAFDPATGSFLGQLRDSSGKPITIDGLWGLDVGNGTVSGDRDALYFSAAPDDHQHGLFGSLRLVADAPHTQTGDGPGSSEFGHSMPPAVASPERLSPIFDDRENADSGKSVEDTLLS